MNNSRFANRIKTYFSELKDFKSGQKVILTDKWNGHSKGEKGLLVPKRLGKVMGKEVNCDALAVQFDNGELEWGLHMDKLKII